MGARWQDQPALRRHDEDVYSHGPALAPVTARLSAIERVQQRIIGGLIVVAALVGGGLIDAIGRGLKVW